MKHEQTFAIAAANGRRPADLVALLRWNAQIRPDKLAYVFLDDGEREAARVTFAELDRRARTIAAHLQDRVAPGARALLLFPPGLDYIEAFFGCLYAKVTAVPAYPPKGRHLQRLSSIWNDADPALVLTTTPLAKQIQNVTFHGSAAAFYTTDQLVEQTGEDWRPATISADDIAFLQYTSGSTADPRGVMVSHGNLIANEALIKESFRHDETSTLVGWLPLYHDMGLVGNILQPLYVGATAYLMSPMAFLEMPVRWLRAISKYNAHTSGGPNFGYELCVRKISEEDKNELDLGGWKVAFSGAEPVRAATLDRFARGFAQCGFRRESFYPCYGLAEATLVVSAPPESRQTPILSLDKKALEQHHAMTTEQNGLNVVGCGRPWFDHDMRIVDPTALTECVNGEIGEIWVSGPCIAKGYWRRETQTRDTFGATIHGGDGSTYLRTGDLGFLDKGELYVTGRIKDLIIVAGKNYYPHDIEAAIEDLVEGLRPGGVTAVPTSGDEEDSFILFAEPHRSALPTLKSDNARSLIHAIGQAIADAIDIAPCEIVVLNPGATPKTSSGKTRRGECRRAYYSGEIDILARSSDLAKHSESAQPRLVDSRASLLQLALAQLAPEQRRPLLARLLVAEAARAVGINESEIDADAPISRIGLHSLKAIELRHTIENMSGVALPLAILLSDASFSEVAGIMSELEIEDRSPVSTNDHCLSFTQQAMWTVQHLDAASNVYNLHLALDIGPIDASRFEAALRATIDANAQLRTVYHNAETGPQAIERRASQYEAPLDDIDASAWGSDELLADASRRIIEPFDIESQIPLRVALYRLAHGNLLLFVAHHISVDLWSLLLFMSELDSRYSGNARVAEAAPYSAFASRQRRYLESARAEDDWQYWRDQLSGELPNLALPHDFPRRNTPSYLGSSKAVRLDAQFTRDLESLAKQEGVSLFAVLLTAYFVLLDRYTGQHDIIVGVPTSGRLDPEFANTIGNFVNPVPIRATLEARSPLRNALLSISQRIRLAQAHQEFPFPVLVDRLRPTRTSDVWPVYQTTFVLQQAQSQVERDLSVIAIGEEARPFVIFGGEGRVRTVSQRVETFELKAMAAKDGDELLISFQYRTQCFADHTIAGLALSYSRILQYLVKDNDRLIADLPVFDDVERTRVLVEWNDTYVPPRTEDSLLHEAFERWAVESPERLAITFEDVSLSFGELNARANQLAHRLIRHYGVQPEQIVAICVDRSIELVIALLAVLKAGGAYLPIDPDLPAERIATMIADAEPLLILTQSDRLKTLQSACGPAAPHEPPVVLLRLDALELDVMRTDNPKRSAERQNLAYLIYTSGSTGRPKGVAVPHRGIVNRLDWGQHRYPLQRDDVLLQKTPYSFDVSVWEFFWPLREGARLIIAPPGSHREPDRIAEIIAREGVTTAHFVPSMLQAFLAMPRIAPMPSLKRVFCSGEALSPALRDAFIDAQSAELHNLYGPTEASIEVSAFDCRSSASADGVSIGRPIANMRLYVLNDSLAPTPIGVAGELYIGGIGLARGYLKHPEWTAERFVPNPFDGLGERLYRTGDVVRYRKDGNIEYLGRADHQVKIRGFRIELGEIESTLLAIDGVAGAVVVARRDMGGDARLVAYVVLTPTAQLVPADLHQALARKLPDYMSPSAIVLLDALPLNRNGKVDRSALPAPVIAELRRNDYVAPRTPLEEQLTRAWQAVLGWERIGVYDNFFDIGGDSIRAIQIANKLHHTDIAITPRHIFQHPTIAAIAESLPKQASERGVEQPPSSYQPFELAEMSDEELSEILVAHPDAADIYRLTPLQEGMLLYSLAQKGVGVYHLQERYRFLGDLNVEVFFGAWKNVVRRHDALRTSFHLDNAGRPYQLVTSDADLECHFEDFSDLGPETRESSIGNYLAHALERGFDLSRSPLLRIHLIKLGPQLHLCVREFHHIILDDWCTSPLMLDVRSQYAASLKYERPPAETPSQFRDYIGWLRSRDHRAAKEYWTRYLAGFTEPTPLAIGASLETTAATSVGDVFAEIDSAAYSELEACARIHRLTTNTFVQAAVGLLLCRYTGLRDVVFGITVAGRPAELASCASALGLFINSLPLRVRIAPDRPVLDLLKTLLNDNLEMREHEFVSQSTIQQWSEIPRVDALLFRHLLTFENAPIDQSLVNDRSIFDIRHDGLRVHTNYPITFVAIPGEKLTLRITYDRRNFDAADVTRLIRNWRLMITELVTNIDGLIGHLTPLASEEMHELFDEWNRAETSCDAPNDLLDRFEEHVRSNGDAIAASCRNETLTFAALDERANRLAHALIEEGFGEGDVLAVFDDRGLNFLTSIVAILKCGSGYLPIDPAYPDGRITGILDEAAAAGILTGARHLARVRRLMPAVSASTARVFDRAILESSNVRTDRPPRRHSFRSIAVVIYTSGSTGKPKGAMLEHRGILNNLLTKIPALALTSSDIIGQTASQAFDISIWQFLIPLATGARVEILPDEISRDPAALVDAIDRCGITILEAVPSMIRALLDLAPEQSLGRLRWLVACGEAFTPELCRRVMERYPSLQILNAYGPAECSDDVTYHRIVAPPPGVEVSVPIGRPVDNCQIYVLDKDLTPAPIRAAGEICVGGVQVGHGYRRRPDLTADAFRPNPYGPPGSILYRTGDRGRWRSDGLLEFLGRVDHQIKIRGHRIEPGEVESRLAAHPQVAEACVLARRLDDGSHQLVAYVVATNGDPSELRTYLAETLPEFMLPSFFVFLDRLPLSTNGKVDRRSLPEPDVAALRSKCHTNPRNPTEQLLAEIWSELLGVDDIGVEDNFFELGGHSLLAIQLRTRIRSAFDVEIPLTELMTATTIERLAARVEETIIADIEAMSDASAERLIAQMVE